MVEPGVVWPDWHITELVALIPLGLSGSQIAVELAKKVGKAYSRNAVIGKASRLGYSLKGMGVLKQPRAKRDRGQTAAFLVNAARRAPPKAIEPEPATSLVPRHLTFEAMVDCDGCRWAYGDSQYTWCGHKRAPETFYCATHYEMSCRMNP